MKITESIFREYDIRGEYPRQINEDVVKEIARAIAYKCIQLDIKEICIGRDGRLSGKTLLDSMIEGLLESGLNVINIDLTTSPLLYFAAKKNKFKSGIMITGSHNPKNHNGIKLVIDDNPISGNEVLNLIKINKNFPNKIGKLKELSVKENYIDEVKGHIKIEKKLKVVIDCGNGAAGFIASDLYTKIGCEVIELFTEVDGSFPNHHPDPGKIENLEDLIKEVKLQKADLGLAFDGDGDRVGLVTDMGEVVFPDKIMMLLSKDILNSQNGSIIFDVKCSNSLSDIIKSYGGDPIMSPTGHFHIKNNIKKYNAVLGGEMSGHIFFNDIWHGFDDGHYSAIRLLDIMNETGSSLDDLLDSLPVSYSTPELNIDVPEERKFKIIEDFIENASIDGKKDFTDGLRASFENGWALLRASNTTPKLVLRFEANSQESLEKIQKNFLEELKKFLPNEDINLE